MRYLPPRILFRQCDRTGLSPLKALLLAESAMEESRYHDAERLIEIVYDGIETKITPHVPRH